jgi:hypothetical protein
VPWRGAPAAVPAIPHPHEVAPVLPVELAGVWYMCGPTGSTSQQGWKLYVPMTMLNARDITSRLVAFLADTGLRFKYVKDIKTLRKLNAGSYGYPQIGKCFVIYLPEPDQRLVQELVQLLERFADQCPAVPCARSFGGRLPLYYRYGSYTSAQIDENGQPVDDDRSDAARAVPSGMADPFAGLVAPVTREPGVEQFLRTYPIVRALVQQGKCGIFHALDLGSQVLREVVLKVGYHRGQVQVDGSDGCDLLRREVAAYRMIAERGLQELAPSLIDAFDGSRKVIAVLEYIDGESLLTKRLRGELTVAQLERAWAVIDQFHAHDVCLGDAKLANFLVTVDDDLRVLDFEGAAALGEPLPAVRTFFVDPAPVDPRTADRTHFLASVLYPYEQGRYSWEDRQVSMEALLRVRPDNEASKWALARLVEAAAQVSAELMSVS